MNAFKMEHVWEDKKAELTKEDEDDDDMTEEEIKAYMETNPEYLAYLAQQSSSDNKDDDTQAIEDCLPNQVPDNLSDTQREQSSLGDDDEPPDPYPRSPLQLAFEVNYPSNHLICGRTNTGKTEMLNGLIMRACHEQQFDRIIVMLGVQDKSSDDYSFLPTDLGWLITEPTIQHVEYIYQQQKSPEFRDVRTCLILDDCMGIINFKRSNGPSKDKINVFQAIAAASRKVNLSVFIVNQSVSNIISPQLRGCMNSIWSPQVMGGDLQTLFDCTTSFETKSSFRAYNNQLKPYEFMRINRTAGADPILTFKSVLCPKWRWDV